MDDEEVAALQDQLAAAQAEIARLQTATADAAARAQQALEEAAALREHARTSAEAAEAAGAESSALRAQIEEAAARERAAVARYREALLRGEAGVPADLVTGDTVDEVDRAFERAREVAGRIRAEIEERAQAGRAPAGAPARAAPDLSALSPEQKIRYGLSLRREA